MGKYLGQSSYRLGKLQYFFKISKIGEVIYCSENICSRKAYKFWRNMLYREGYAETMLVGVSPPLGNSRIGTDRPIFLEFSRLNL